ncbi:hypothetical protein E2320_012787 [Naja naja]|nr:hypothetical protein E2320_012787 [Naja naja]
MLVPGDENFLTDVIYIAFELVIALLAVFGNVLVCWAVYLNSNLQNVTNYFVASLAVADIAVGVLAIPFAITISTGFCAFFYGCLFIACFVLVQCSRDQLTCQGSHSHLLVLILHYWPDTNAGLAQESSGREWAK